MPAVVPLILEAERVVFFDVRDDGGLGSEEFREAGHVRVGSHVRPPR